MPPSTFDVIWLQVRPQRPTGLQVAATVGQGYQAGPANCHARWSAPEAKATGEVITRN